MRTDEALYLDLLAGDMTAFDELYRRYERRLFGYILRLLGDHGEAEELFHEVFMAVLQERRTNRQLESFRAWIFQVARNLCSNRLRTRRRAAAALQAARALPAQAHASAAGDDAEQLLTRQEVPAALQRAIDRLPDQLGELYHLRASGLSYDEIAETLDVPLGTVKSRMHEMIVRLRREMQPWIAN
jgi:RNA polymerase sigma-70 factor (ECF subfamily)